MHIMQYSIQYLNDILTPYQFYNWVCSLQALLLNLLLHQVRDNPPWNSDNESYFADQEYSLPSPMSHHTGSLNLLVQFLSDILDWNSFDKSGLNHVLQGLPVPIPGPAPHGISLQEAINVSPPSAYNILYCYILYAMSYCIQYCILSLHNTIPHSLLHAIPAGPATNSRPDSRAGSRLFEVNIWMWCYG